MGDRDKDSRRRVYVGNLPHDVRERELDDYFYKYGRISDISIKGPYAFIEFDDSRDAEDAVRGRDGTHFLGGRIRVEFAGRDRRRGATTGGSRYTGKRSEYRLEVSNLPRGSSWQDLKDFAREAGEILYTNVNTDSTGVIEFAHQGDMEWALKNLDNKEFRSHLGEKDVVSLREETSGGSRHDSPARRSRSRSRSRSRGRRSPSRSPPRSRGRGRRSPSVSRSPSPAEKRDKSPRRSRDASPRDSPAGSGRDSPRD